MFLGVADWILQQVGSFNWDDSALTKVAEIRRGDQTRVPNGIHLKWLLL